ncbi:MAG: OmpA family protein [Bacteroidota bacterium]
MKLKLTNFFIVLLIAGSALAQSSATKSADVEYDKQNYFEAKDLYKKAYTKEKDKAIKTEILFKIGDCYRMLLDNKNEIQWLEKAIKAKYPDPIALLYLAQAQKMSGKYADATVTFNKYKAAVPSDNRGELGAQSCELSAKWIQKPTRYSVNNMVGINSKFSDFATCYAKKDLKVVMFTSNRQESLGNAVDEGTGSKFSDIFETSLDRKGKWSTAKALPAPVNSPMNDGACCFDKKYTEMFFTRSLNMKGKVRSKLFVTKRRGQTWDEPTSLPFCNDDSSSYGHPSLSPDGTTLFYTSDIPGGQGGFDIYFSKYDKAKKAWGDPVNCGPNVNTDRDDQYPFIRSDTVLYFSSYGHLGMGGLDIYRAVLADGAWGNVTNMKYPINSPADDFAIVFEDEKRESGYLSSNRDGGKGSDDIYSFYLPPIVLTLKGVARDKDNNNEIPDAKIEMVGSDGSSVSAVTDKSGGYKFDSAQFHPNVIYKLAASKKDYLGDKGEESTMGQELSKDYIHDFKLKFVKKPIVLPNVMYVFDQATLIDVSFPSLDTLVKVLNDNPTITIELDANTDARGDADYNKKLSQRRADTVVMYLIQHGIDSARLKPVGMGKSNPRTLTEDVTATGVYKGKELKPAHFKKGDYLTESFIAKLSSEDEKEAAHQLNRRTEVKILTQNYVPKGGIAPQQEVPKETPKEAPKKDAPKKDAPKKDTPVKKDTKTTPKKK